MRPSFCAALVSAFLQTDVLIGVITIGALGVAIYQSILARRSVDAARHSIDEDKRARQLSMISKISWVIEVQIRLDRWLKELRALKRDTLSALENGNEDTLKRIAESVPRTPNDARVRVRKLLYEHMPDFLREIMMSGAQYYYDAMSPASFLWTEDKGANWDYASSIQKRYNESITALRELKKLIAEAVPGVLLETPASLDDREFVE